MSPASPRNVASWLRSIGVSVSTRAGWGVGFTFAPHDEAKRRRRGGNPTHLYLWFMATTWGIHLAHDGKLSWVCRSVNGRPRLQNGVTDELGIRRGMPRLEALGAWLRARQRTCDVLFDVISVNGDTDAESAAKAMRALLASSEESEESEEA